MKIVKKALIVLAIAILSALIIVPAYISGVRAYSYRQVAAELGIDSQTVVTRDMSIAVDKIQLGEDIWVSQEELTTEADRQSRYFTDQIRPHSYIGGGNTYVAIGLFLFCGILLLGGSLFLYILKSRGTEFKSIGELWAYMLFDDKQNRA